jgi:hypothetical protein
LAVQQLLAKISRVTRRASAATRAHVSSVRSAAADATVVAIAVADARIMEGALTPVADVPIAADAPAVVALVSNAVPDPVGQDMTVVTREAAPVPRADRSLFPRC